MNYLHAIILAIVEGATEFLPISSTGHLILTSHLLNLQQTDFLKSFEIVIQFSAILAVIFHYRPTLTNINIMKRILVGFIPTAVVGLLFYSFIKNYLLENILITIITLFVGGIILILFERLNLPKRNAITTLEDLSYKNAIIIGLCQSLSIIPGVSRAAASILGGLSVGLSRQTAVEYSFFLAIPTITGATMLDLLKSNLNFNPQESTFLLIGCAVSFITALTVLKKLIKFIKNNNFIWFGIYRIVLALIFLIFIL